MIGHNQEGDQEVRRVFGFPDFWPTVEAEYPKFFEVSPNLLTALRSVTDQAFPNPEPHERAILNLGMLAGVCFAETIVLTVNGFGHGAMRTLRTLLETCVNAEYLRLRPAEFEDYKEWYWVERFKEQEYLRLHANNIFQQLTPQVIQELNQNMARIRGRFERTKYDGTRELRSSWCSRNLADRSAVTGHQTAYRLINPLASRFVHETMYGLMGHFDPHNDIDRIDVPPTLQWSAQALSGAQHCMLGLVNTVAQTMNVTVEPTIQQLERDNQYAWTADVVR